ncbi:MAG: hypothetical protein LBT09_16095 [Planctomycetaceae bacterium]|jgi:hypothetical protein|nr:hypothetical protein [Planctomycetaceae bacterium]
MHKESPMQIILRIIFIFVIFISFSDKKNRLAAESSELIFKAALEVLCDPNRSDIKLQQRVQELSSLAVLQRIDGKNSDAEKTIQIAKEFIEAESDTKIRERLFQNLTNPQTVWFRNRRLCDSPFINDAFNSFCELCKEGKPIEAFQSLDHFALQTEFQPLLTELSRNNRYDRINPFLRSLAPADAIRFAESLKSPVLREFMLHTVRQVFLPQKKDDFWNDFSIALIWNDPHLEHQRSYKDGSFIKPRLPQQLEQSDEPNLEEMLDLVSGFENSQDRIEYYFLIANDLINRTFNEATGQIQLEKLDRNAFYRVLRLYEKEIPIPDEQTVIDNTYSDKYQRTTEYLLRLANLYMKIEENTTALQTLQKIETIIEEVNKKVCRENERNKNKRNEKSDELKELITETIWNTRPMKLSYGEQAWLAGSYLKAGDEKSYRRLRDSLSEKTRPRGFITCPVREIKLYEFSDIFCRLELFEEAVTEWTVDQYQKYYPIRNLTERTWRRAAANGMEQKILNFVRILPNELRKIILLDEIIGLLEEADKPEEMETVCREAVELAQTLSYFETILTHPFVKIAVEEKDFRTAWKRIEILTNSYSWDVEQNLIQNFAYTIEQSATEIDFDCAYRHAAAIQCFDAEIGALGYIAVKQYQLGKTEEVEKTLELARSKIGKKPEFLFEYPKPQYMTREEGYGMFNFISCLLYLERFDEAIQYYHTISNNSYRYELLFDRIIDGLCQTGQVEKGYSLFQECSENLNPFYYSWLHLYKFCCCNCPEIASVLRGQLLTMILNSLDENRPSQSDPLENCRILRELGNLVYETLGETELAKKLYRKAFQKALLYSQSISPNDKIDQFEIYWIAQCIMKEFGTEEAENAYCQSIIVLKNDDPYDFPKVVERVEDYLYQSRKFIKTKNLVNEKFSPVTQSDPKEWKHYLLSDFVTDHHQ